ncbi:MAG: FG-GAP repeat protein, partial [Phycisphaerae bacterium]
MPARQTSRSAIAFIIIASLTACAATATGQTIRNVDDDAPGDDVQTWTIPYQLIQDALAEAALIVAFENLSTLQFTDCNSNGTADDVDIANDPALDCNTNSTLDSCDIAAGGADCNTNGVPDACDFVFSEPVELVALDAMQDDVLGFVVGINGTAAIVGAFLDDAPLDNSGSAYIFRLAGGAWAQEAKLVHLDAQSGDELGFAVSIFGNTAIAGAYRDDDGGDDSGSAYVFRFDGGSWAQSQKLTAPDAAAGDQFGKFIDMEGDIVVIGSAQDDDNDFNSGSAYVFRWNGATWVFEQKLTASDGQAGDGFGKWVSVSNNAILVGAFRDDDGGSQSGSAYVFRWNGASWVQEQKLTASDPSPDDQFGYSVEINGDVAIVSAPFDDDGATDSGAAYVFRWNGVNWLQEQKLKAPIPGAGDDFGRSVAIEGNLIVAGADFNDAQGVDSGAAFAFRFQGGVWTHSRTFDRSDGAPGDNFGVSAAIREDQRAIIIGSVLDNAAGAHAGSAYVFAEGINDCNTNDTPDACDIAAGSSADCNSNDVPDECEPDCNTNGAADVCDLAAGSSTDCNINGIPDVCESDDCNTNDSPDDCDIAGGTSTDVNSNGVPDACESDCNTNDVPDDLDISAQTSQDCNTNATPDECDTVAGAPDCNSDGVPDACESDCNTNNVPDGCDVAGATSADCNTNAVPDECDFELSEIVELVALDAAPSDRLGNAVGISGSAAIVGAFLNDSTGVDSGAAYVFRLAGGSWVQEAKLVGADTAAGDEFGRWVSIHNDTAVVGARLDDDAGAKSGSAYVFRFNSGIWIQEQKLSAPDAAAGDEFGQSVDVQGDVAVVSSFKDDDKGGDSGSVHVFLWNGTTWTHEQKLTASDGQSGDQFGKRVSISGDAILVGAWGDDDDGTNSGSAYVFRWNGVSWAQEQKLTASDAAATDQFGFTVEIAGNAAIVSALFE